MKYDQLGILFAKWWHEYGSGVIPLPEHDLEEHLKRVSEKAFKAGYLEGIKEDK